MHKLPRGNAHGLWPRVDLAYLVEHQAHAGCRHQTICASQLLTPRIYITKRSQQRKSSQFGPLIDIVFCGDCISEDK
jgi:hypothetical protein